MERAAKNDADVTIAAIGQERVGALRDLWLALHRHHGEIGSQPLVENETASWEARRALYDSWLRSDEGFIVLAERDGQPLGYAAVLLHNGPDDTYPVAARWAEIYSLSVIPTARGQGIGTRLLDAVDERLTAMDIRDVAVSAMVENTAALRLYSSRGFVPRELFLFRFSGAETP